VPCKLRDGSSPRRHEAHDGPRNSFCRKMFVFFLPSWLRWGAICVSQKPQCCWTLPVAIPA
jgi:hypothetical protein